MLLEDFVTTGWVVRQKIWKPLRVARSGGAYGERDATCNCSLIAFL
jgi:hypothetical protein